MIKMLLWSTFLLQLSATVNAQQTDKQRAMILFRDAMTRYQSSGGLRFSLTYKYASEERPGQYLDSLHGYIETMGDKYHYRLDSTEIVGNHDLTAILFHEDHTIYLTRTPSFYRSKNPLALLDSMLLKNDSLTCSIRDTTNAQLITLSFPPGSAYKRVEYYIDRRDGYIRKIRYLVPAKELYDPSVRSSMADNRSFSFVETDFSGYQQGVPNIERLDVHNYYKKEGTSFIALSPYTSYNIIAGNPDL